MRIGLELPPGIVSDDTYFSSVGRWEDGSNVRPWRGQMQTVGGWTAAFADTVSGTCRSIHPWTDNSGALNIAFGSHSHLMVAFGQELFDITPVGLTVGAIDASPGSGFGAGDYDEGAYGEPTSATSPRLWSFANYGENLIASPRRGKLYQWENNTASLSSEIANAPDEINSILVTPERQILALGCNEETSGSFNGLCIRGSDLEDPTTWTTTASNNAFEHVLEGGGRIITGDMVGPYVAVWTDNSLHVGQYIGDPGQTYRFDLVAENCGLIGPNSVAIVGQTAYWIGPDYQFRVWSLGGVPQIIPCPIRNDFKDHVETAQAEKIAAGSVSQYGEVWFHYPDSRDGSENSRYVAISTADPTAPWFRGTMARTAFCDAGVAGWPLGVDPSGNVYFHEYGQTANGGILPYFIATAATYLGEADQTFMIRGAWPDFEDQAGAVSMTVSTSMFPQAERREHGPFALSKDQSKKDFRASGRIASIRFEGASAPSFMRTGKPSFDVVVTGQR